MANKINQSDAKLKKIGLATAKLHKLLKELDYARNLERTAATMPDARDRLSYIDGVMHEASEKTISAVETSLPLAKKNRLACEELARSLSSATPQTSLKETIETTISKLGEIAAAEEIIQHNLVRIMEAQEFRDVAGQMVNKIASAAIEVEQILLEILKEYAPTPKDSLISSEGLTAGPATKPKSDAVQGQDEVDDLLASLGL